jgi:hypothetical protein
MTCWTPGCEQEAQGIAWGGPDAQDENQILVVCAVCIETARSFGMRVRLFKRYRAPVVG